MLDDKHVDIEEWCVLVEALKSVVKGKERIIEEMSLIDDFENMEARKE